MQFDLGVLSSHKVIVSNLFKINGNLLIQFDKFDTCMLAQINMTRKTLYEAA